MLLKSVWLHLYHALVRKLRHEVPIYIYVDGRFVGVSWIKED